MTTDEMEQRVRFVRSELPANADRLTDVVRVLAAIVDELVKREIARVVGKQ